MPRVPKRKADDILSMIRNRNKFREADCWPIEGPLKIVDRPIDDFSCNCSVLQDYPITRTVDYTIDYVLHLIEQNGLDTARELLNDSDRFPDIIEKLVWRHHKAYSKTTRD